MPGGWPDKLCLTSVSVDNNTHTPLGACVLQVTLYKHATMTCAMILSMSDDWDFQVKGYIIIFSYWCETIYLSGKQNHLQQDKSLAMLKLFCMLFHACTKGRFDQTKTCTAVTEFLKFILPLIDTMR